jgi:fumarate reductase subunit D
MLLGFGFMIYVLVFVHLDSTGRSMLSDPVVITLVCSLSTLGEIDTNNIPHFEELINILTKRFAALINILSIVIKRSATMKEI